jgi:hypothetical protein
MSSRSRLPVAHRSESVDDRDVGGHAAGARIISTTSARIDQLYGLTPGEFTAARNALAKELRTEGQRDEAGQVAKLRRPTIAAWAINQVVRIHGDRFAALLDAGQQVRRAQRRALSGVRDSGLREATRTRRQLIDELTDLAAQALAEQGSSAESHRGDIAATFDAASADDDAAEVVHAARLAAPLPVASDFGGVDALAVLPSPEPPQTAQAPAAAGAPGDTDTDTDTDTEREHAAQRRREAIRAVDEARREVAKAEEAASAAEDEALECAAAADDAARAAREAEVRWRRLQLEADSMQPRVAQTRARADKARQTVERLMARLLERENELAEWPDD